MKKSILKKLAVFSAAAGVILCSISASAEELPYTVKQGDNLSRIARQVYGDSLKWHEIYDRNKDQIKDPNLIYVNQTLILPDIEGEAKNVPEQTDASTVDNGAENTVEAAESANTKATKAEINAYLQTADTAYENKDYDTAYEYYNKAAKEADDQAAISYVINRLGYMYEFGLGIEKDYAKAKEWYEKAIDLGSEGALNNLGVMYSEGKGVKKDYAKALELYMKSADMGNTNGMLNVGGVYLYDYGDYAQALEWFENLAALGVSESAYYIGYIYENGLGVEQDYTKAALQYQKAVNSGDLWSVYNLGYLYWSGNGVVQNSVRAAEMLKEILAGGGSEFLNELLNEDWTDDRIQNREERLVQMAEWIEQTADSGNSDAMNSLGYMYKNGIGVKKDPETAREWFDKAGATE